MWLVTIFVDVSVISSSLYIFTFEEKKSCINNNRKADVSSLPKKELVLEGHVVTSQES